MSAFFLRSAPIPPLFLDHPDRIGSSCSFFNQMFEKTITDQPLNPLTFLLVNEKQAICEKLAEAQ